VTPVNVLVAFYSRYGKAEQLALAAGVGAIQARANIRLRRVADLAEAKLIQADSEWTTHLDRMNRDYVVPRPADPVWADVIVLAGPEDSPRELEQYVASLPSVGSMTGKIAAPLRSGRSDSALALHLRGGGRCRPDCRAGTAERGRPHCERTRTRPARRPDGAGAQESTRIAPSMIDEVDID
jgi:hypothetical protein